MRFRALPDADQAQLRAIDALYRGGSAERRACARYAVVDDSGEHRYDAWVVHGWLPLVVFAPGGAEVLAWWSDQDSDTETFADADAVYAAYEQALR